MFQTTTFLYWLQLYTFSQYNIQVWIEALTNEKLILQTKEAQERDKFMNDKLKAAREQKVRERRASEIEREEQKKRWVGVYS